MDPAVKSNNDPLHKGTPNEGCHWAGISQSLGGTRSIGLSRRLTRPINAKSEKGEYEHNGKPKSQLMLLLFPLSLFLFDCCRTKNVLRSTMWSYWLSSQLL